MGTLSKSQTIGGVAFVVLVWGSVWPIYKVALDYCPPVLFSAFRSLVAGVLFSLFLLPKWRQLQWRQNWRIYSISTAINVVAFFGLQSIGLQYLPAGLFAVIVYLQPVLVVLLAWLWLHESLTPRKLVGVLMGFMGVAFVSLEGISGTISMVGIWLALLAGLAWAVGTIYAKSVMPRVDAMWFVAIQNLVGSILLLGLGVGVEDIASVEWTWPLIGGLLYGGIFGVTLAFVVYYKLIHAGEAGKVSSFTFLVPLISVLISTLTLNEPFTLSLFLGMVLILLSIIMINWKATKSLPAVAARSNVTAD